MNYAYILINIVVWGGCPPNWAFHGFHHMFTARIRGVCYNGKRK